MLVFPLLDPFVDSVGDVEDELGSLWVLEGVTFDFRRFFEILDILGVLSTLGFWHLDELRNMELV